MTKGSGRGGRGRYSANTLGTIKSHLEGLQGYEVMALELIQNADDAQANSITFDVRSDALYVENDAPFVDCGDVEAEKCLWSTGIDGGKTCDFHRITDVASGGKSRDPENIGRFGIGFVSVYQITDHPEIRSNGIELILIPEEADFTYQIDPDIAPRKANFRLPWAKDGSTSTRRGLGASAITDDDISELPGRLIRTLDESLLFLRNVAHGEVRVDGKSLARFTVERNPEQNTTVVLDSRNKQPRHWFVLQADASESLKPTLEQYPRLGELNRSAKVTVAVPIGPIENFQGRFFAFLPTEQRHGLPCHINADFFPAPSRTAIVLSGGKHQEAWNGALIGCAAGAISDHMVELRDTMGAPALWQLIDDAYRVFISVEHEGAHPYLAGFWQALVNALANDPQIVPDATGRWRAAKDVLVTKLDLPGPELEVIEKIGGHVADASLSEYSEVLIAAGAELLTIVSLCPLLSRSPLLQTLVDSGRIARQDRSRILENLWSLTSQLLLGEPASADADLATTPLFLTHDERLIPLEEGLSRPSKVSLERLLKTFPELRLPHPRLEAFPRVCGIAPPLGPSQAILELEEMFTSPGAAKRTLGDDINALRKFYLLVRDLTVGMDREARPHELHRLGGLPIFRCGHGFAPARGAYLPGDFVDPIGVSSVLQASCFDLITQAWLRDHLGVGQLSIETYVQEQLPLFFQEAPEPKKYKALIIELSRHPQLFNSDHIKTTLADLKMVPTRDGGWDTADRVYRHTEALEELLGFGDEWWLDEQRIPSAHTTDAFYAELGVRQQPCAEHVLMVMRTLTEQEPTGDILRQAERLFYVLCENFPAWSRDGSADLEHLEEARHEELFPADGVEDEWFSGDKLYAPFRAPGFETQANILPFRNTRRINTETLEFFGIRGEPETSLVTAHVRECSSRGIGVSSVAYQILNDRMRQEDEREEIESLEDSACIWDSAFKRYLRPTQLFWNPPRLGRFAFRVPDSLSDFRHLLEALGVRMDPSPQQLVGVIRSISEEYDEGRVVSSADYRVLHHCLTEISLAISEQRLSIQDDESILERIPSVPTLINTLAFPEDVAVDDSPWHSEPFGQDLLGFLVPDDPALMPLYAALRIPSVSAAVRTKAAEVGTAKDQPDLSARLLERSRALVRLLEDYPHPVRRAFLGKLDQLTVKECEELRLQYVWNRASDEIESEPLRADAYLSAENSILYVRTDLDDEQWPELLKALFHGLLPKRAGHDFRQLVLNAMSVLDKDSATAAHRYLDLAGVPPYTEPEILEELGVDSELLESLGEDDEPEYTTGPDGETDLSPVEFDHRRLADEPIAPEEDIEHHPEEPTEDEQKQSKNGVQTRDTRTTHTELQQATAESSVQKGKSRRSESAATKARRRNRLRSYVRPDQESEVSDDVHNSSGTSDVYEVEDAARAAVCQYERRRGRDPEEMPAMHPGYDIKSYDERGEVVRLIEVKGIDGEWVDLGVGLKRRQFSEAWKCQDLFWLYVVEFAKDTDRARVYAIQNPAQKVDEYFFDQNWRGVSEAGQDELKAAFKPGARIRHVSLWGMATIVEIRPRGRIMEMVFDLDRGGRRARVLNVTEWEIITDEELLDGDDLS